MYNYLEHQSTIIPTFQEKHQVQYNPEGREQDAFLPPEGTGVFTKEESLFALSGGIQWAFALDGVTLVFFFRPSFKGLRINMAGRELINAKEIRNKEHIAQNIQSLPF